MGKITFFDREVTKYKGDSNFIFYALMTILIAGAAIALVDFISDKQRDKQGCALEVVVCKGESNY
jgi:hypothetical protein